MHYFDPYLYGLHPERKLYPDSFESFIREDVQEKVASKTAIRQKHEYFLYFHVSYDYGEVLETFCTETLWKAKQFKFRAATDKDFGYYETFKKEMEEVYIPDRETKLSENELKEIKDFVKNARPEDFKIMDPDTRGMVQYNRWRLRRLNNAIRDYWVPFYGTQRIGKSPEVYYFGDPNPRKQWMVNILNGIE
ncbi:hypothetical protein TVAG_432290 [Trichomonas vaginalis G3]|uniref:Uncharacterized protein n=1 Tax=Trichomonas vaginalis (strain ATCC PRA-98 / G3) TaxID=412133 RepID=A2F8U3_TRIV3|nr:hypothetical protein TVAGG3_0126680 [Trichomonas vaginalis G3]EAX98679.1 hypothetical protein TVAG_432290 [Trichomonas vaginalis G3]KAI5545810.1 hypothetical protein TVAGG3_0126680 [Trichomonas vaginalis G3]|eukprot:XP_001311609.1 hypothetical protein [Trichomonas vaginalis G3]